MDPEHAKDDDVANIEGRLFERAGLRTRHLESSLAASDVNGGRGAVRLGRTPDTAGLPDPPVAARVTGSMRQRYSKSNNDVFDGVRGKEKKTHRSPGERQAFTLYVVVVGVIMLIAVSFSIILKASAPTFRTANLMDVVSLHGGNDEYDPSILGSDQEGSEAFYGSSFDEITSLLSRVPDPLRECRLKANQGDFMHKGDVKESPSMADSSLHLAQKFPYITRRTVCMCLTTQGKVSSKAFPFYTNCVLAQSDDAPPPRVPLRIEDDVEEAQGRAKRKCNSGNCPSVLVLGSSGVLGKALVAELEHTGHHVLEVMGPNHIDLRHADAMNTFVGANITFAFYLAIDVGKQHGNVNTRESRVLENNRKMHKSLKFLEENAIPYIALGQKIGLSSVKYLDAVEKVYETRHEILEHSRVGKLVRTTEILDLRSDPLQVVGQVIKDCMQTGTTNLRAFRGNEPWRVVFAGDVASKLVFAMNRFADLQPETNIMSASEFTLTEIVANVDSLLLRGCKALFGGKLLSGSAVVHEQEELAKASNTLRTTSFPPRMLLTLIKEYDQLEKYESEDVTGKPYLSVIVPGGPSDNSLSAAIRSYNFVRIFVELARRHRLRYEIIFVQYVSKSRSPPLNRYWPWSDSTLYTRVKVLMVAEEDLHISYPLSGDYIAMNIGARRAQGDFLLFMSASMIVSDGLIKELAKETLNSDCIYRTRFVKLAESYDASMSTRSMISACTVAGEHLSDIDGPANSMIGTFAKDFLIIHTSHFDARWGFPENPFLSGSIDELCLRNFMCPSATGSVSLKVLEDPICEQTSTEPPVDMPVDVTKRFSCSNNYQRRRLGFMPDFGAPDLEFPKTGGGDIFQSGVNTLMESRAFEHHHVMRYWTHLMRTVPLEDEFVTDFLGVRKRLELVCGDRRPELGYRSADCRRHVGLMALNVRSFIPHLPIMDRSYYSWLAALDMAHSAAQLGTEEVALAEFGTEFGEWSIRAAAGLRHLRASARITLYLSDVLNPSELNLHLNNNRFINLRAISLADLSSELASLPLLHGLFLSEFASNDALLTTLMDQHEDFLRQKVLKIKVHLRTSKWNDTVRRFTQEWMWKLEFAFNAQVYQTPFGPMDFSDGARIYLTNAPLQKELQRRA